MTSQALGPLVDGAWDGKILPVLCDYIRIPNVSPAFDREWRSNGEMDRAVALVCDWIEAQAVPGLALDVVRLESRTPLIVAEVAGDLDDTVLLYGHLDKQPPMEPWSEGLGPWTPVRREDRLYGRGGADDGYAAFASVTALGALKRLGVRTARCVILIEACEESGSYDLPHYMEALAPRIGQPSFVVCLDSGCGDYERLWVTTSLRGLVNGTLRVATLTEGVHSGMASGIVPSTFRIARQLLSRLEDPRTGAILPSALHAEIPAERLQQAGAAARVLGASIAEAFPFQPRAHAVSDDPSELLLNRTWRPQLEIIGAEGLPTLERAGNVMRPSTAVQLSVRLPPTVDAACAVGVLRQLLEDDPPYGAKVEFKAGQGSSGWNAPPTAPWLAQAIERASQKHFGASACYQGEGGSIPFMHMLGQRFPSAQFLITGVLGPHSNAHGPNEFLHVPMAKRLTACVAEVVAAHAARTT